MINYAQIYALADQLEALRTSGMLIFDTRDRGNYSTYELPNTWALLEKEDPTGIAASLLLAEMLEATLHLSAVKLPRVLLEPDFVEQLRALLAMREQLSGMTDAPRDELITRLSAGLRVISEDFGTVDRRELAICLRDALYSLSQGLTLSWVTCNPKGIAYPQLPLAKHVEHYETLSAFIDSLRDERPDGAYLGVIGPRFQTVIGLKHPCGTAYLSSSYIDTHSGQMAERRATNYHMAESLDLDKVTERYPEWHKLFAEPTPTYGRSIYPVAPPTPKTISLADLPRDNVLWLALVVEMARQRMEQMAPQQPALTETLQRALLAPGANLPVVQRNWVVRTPTLTEVVNSLGLTPWALAQCEDIWQGLTTDHFLPEGTAPVALNRESLMHSPWKTSSECWGYPGGYDQFALQHVKLCPVGPGLAGTQAELEAARNAILRKNVQAFAVDSLNYRVTRFWLTEGHAWFREKLQSRITAALTDPSTRIQTSDGPIITHFCKESPKHKTFHARCWFNVKLVPNLWAVIRPNDSADLVRLLGLASEEELPPLLQGWTRLPNQALGDSQKVYWAWNSLSDASVFAVAEQLGTNRMVPKEGFMMAKVSLNTASVPDLQPTPGRLHTHN